MKILPLITFLLIASPLSAQSRLYTNADVGRSLSPNRRTVTPEELESLKAGAFKAASPSSPEIGGVYVVAHDPLWPFTTSTLQDIGKPLSEPWSMTTYLGRGSYGSGIRHRGHARPVDPRPGIHLIYGR